MSIFERNLILVTMGIVGFLGVASFYSTQSPSTNPKKGETSTQIQVPDQASVDASDQSVESGSIEVLEFESSAEFQIALGMMGPRDGDAMLQKDLGSGRYSRINFGSMTVSSVDASAWEQGGNLILINHNSYYKKAYQIACSISPGAGDEFMRNGYEFMSVAKQRSVKIDGSIKSYSSSVGLLVEPCVASEITK